MRKNDSRSLGPVGLPTSPVPGGATAGAGPGAEALLQGLPWGMVVLDAHGTVLWLNQQAAHWWGVSPAALRGQPLGLATAGTLPPDLQQALQQVPRNLSAPPSEFFLPQSQQWIAMTSAREADDYVVYWQDITAQKQATLQHEARQTARALLLLRTEAVAHTGSYELELATGQLQLSDGLFRLFGEGADAFDPNLLLIEARTHPDDVTRVQQILARAIADHQPYYYLRRIYRPDGQLRTLEAHGRVECDAQGQPVKLLGLMQDVTEREQAQQELLRVKDELAQRVTASYVTLYTSMDEGFCIVEVLFDEAQRALDYRFLDINPAFEQQTGLRDALGKNMRELAPAHEQYWFDNYGRVALTGEPTRFEAYSDSMSRWFSVNAFAMDLAHNRHVAVLFTDITERKQSEQTLRESEARQAYLLALSDALRPVVAAAEVQATVARTARHHFQADRCYYGEIAGDTVTIRRDAARPGLPSVAGVYALSSLPLFDKTPRESQPVVVADVDASPLLDDNLKHYCQDNHILAYISVPVSRHGELVGILCLTQSTPREWTTLEVSLLQETAERTRVAVERSRAEDALRQSEEQFRLLIAATSDTVYRMGPDWTQMEQMHGKDFLADTLGPTRTWVEEYIPANDLPPVKAAIAEAIRHKSLFELEHCVRRADGTVGWTYSRAVPMLGAQGELTGWLGTARDVSIRKLAEAQLQEFATQLEKQVAERTRALGESQALLQSVFDSTTTAVVLLQAVRDAAGQLLDFEYVLVNPVAQAQSVGRSLIGQRYGERHPSIYHTPIFEHFKGVVETGRRADFEVHYAYEGYNHWFRLVATKLGDGLLFTAEDITARKLLAQTQAKGLALLLESEEVAGMGSWDYDLATHALTWSDGLYHLFGRPVGTPVRPQHFLDAVLDDDRPQAARLLRSLAAGTDHFDELLRLRVGEAVKTVRFKAVPLPHTPGPPVRVLGVCLDVSDVARLEAENLALKLDRHKELLLAILQAQEDERQRLGEVLHNSLGQVLYAIKLHLDQLDTPALHALPALFTLHQHTDRLLAEAMHQTRTLAHELVPTSLANFGLARAIRDICHDLSTPQLLLQCQVWGEDYELPQPVQVALFRLAQELAHNIVRHAGATQALLELETLPDWVSLRAEDNGRGFDPQAVAEGLGLRTVRDAVALLGGTVAIDSTPQFGTHVRLRIPLPLFS